MIISIDVDAGVKELLDAEVFTAFHINSDSTVEEVTKALASTHDEVARDNHVWVPVAIIRELAGGAVDEDWESQFQAMLGYAESKGWMTPDGTHVEAHIEPFAP